MPKMICVKCEVELTCKQNGVGALYTFLPDERPCSIYDADLWSCPICGLEIVSGFGAEPIAEHYRSDMEKVIGMYGRVVRCRELGKVQKSS